MAQTQNKPIVVEDEDQAVSPMAIPLIPRHLWVLVGIWGLMLTAATITFWLRTESKTSAIQGEIEALNGATTQHRLVSDIYLKILIRKKDIDPRLAYEISEVVRHESTVFKRSPNLVIAIMEHESNFDPKAVSSVGAVGLLQVMPQWKGILGTPEEDLTDIRINIRRGLQILASYEHHYQDLNKALTAYNRGAGPVDTALMRGYDHNNGYADRILETYEWLNGIDRAQAKQ